MVVAVVTWLSQQGPRATKHHGWVHPIVVLCCHYAILVAVAFGLHDWLIDNENWNKATPAKYPFSSSWEMSAHCQLYRNRVGWWLACYSIWFLPWRIVFCCPSIPRHTILYEFTWLCNGTLVLGSLASLFNRPVISIACCVTVGIDQLLWYVDLLGYLVSGRFPVGVARYLTWPQTTWASRITCTHHLWTIPLLLSTSGGIVPFSALMLSFVLMVLNVCLSRAMIPFEVHVPKTVCKKVDGHTTSRRTTHAYDVVKQSKYLNVNLSYELWKDIKIELLQINYDNPPVLLYLFRLLWRWQGFNTLVYLILTIVGKLAFAGDSHVCKPQIDFENSY